MGYTIIHRKDKEKLSDMVAEMLRIGGRMMSCIEEMSEDEDFGESSGGRYGNRYVLRDGGRYGNRLDEDPYEMEERRFNRRRH
ncbi:MAG: hypothetical protein IJ764_00505 [Bacteroidales bacterium]|nr:hypothetical protein [Bacteroidales bacterium]